MPSRSTIDKSKLEALSELLSYKLDDLIHEFSVDVKPCGRRLIGPCPIHCGDNRGAFNLYPDGHTSRGNWQCLTRHCEHIFHGTALGLVRGLLSTRNGWTIDDGRAKLHNFNDTIKWACRFVGKSWDQISGSEATAEKHRFIALANTLKKRVETPDDGWTPAFIRERLNIPSPYYLSRGFGKEVLIRFDIGDSKIDDANHPMYRRMVVPVFNREAARVVGVTARAISDDVQPKWRNSKDFSVQYHLFNYWNAAPVIRRTNEVIIVEGVGDALRMVEAGCENVVALFGASMSDTQHILIESSGAMTMTLLLDNDEAGQIGRAHV